MLQAWLGRCLLLGLHIGAAAALASAVLGAALTAVRHSLTDECVLLVDIAPAAGTQYPQDHHAVRSPFRRPRRRPRVHARDDRSTDVPSGRRPESGRDGILLTSSVCLPSAVANTAAE